MPQKKSEFGMLNYKSLGSDIYPPQYANLYTKSI